MVREPFSLSLGLITPANGLTYDMSYQKQELADDSAKYWVDQMAACIHTIVPDLLIDANMFSYYAVGRTGPGDWTYTGDYMSDRVPFRPLALVDSDVSYLNMHAYPIDEDELDATLQSLEIDLVSPALGLLGKPLIMGEFGAFKSHIPDLLDADEWVSQIPYKILDYGFEGWLYWTYDTYEQGGLWNASDGDWMIFNSLIDADQRLYLNYFEDNFDVDNTTYWITDSSYGVTNGILYQTNPVGLQKKTANIGDLNELVVECKVKLEESTGWTGIHFHKSDPNQAPWQGGYLVRLHDSGKVVLYKQGLTIDYAWTGLDVVNQFVHLKVSEIGNRIFVYVNGSRFISAKDETYTGGYCGLVTFDQTAEFDDFLIRRVMRRTIDFTDDFDDGNYNGWRIDGSATWNVINGEMYRDPFSNGLGLATIENLQYQDFQAKVRMRMDTGSGWAGIHFRKENPTDAPWKTGYMVFYRNDAIHLYGKINGVPGIIDSTPIQIPFREWFTLEVRVIGNRICMMVNGNQLLSHWDETYTSTGYFSLVNLDQGVRYDDIELSVL